VNTDEDARHCGDCATACVANAVCSVGLCECLPAFPDLCPDACVDLGVDPDHCGECDVACVANAICTAGACSCPPELPDECPDACADLDLDPAHCGTCTTRCPTGGVCTSGACECPPALPDLCPGTPGSCVDVDTDEQNCGVCGRSCTSGQTCTGGVCCGTGLPVCSATCCAGGTACCDGACPFGHQNGLGQSYFSCTPTGTHDRAAAGEAAAAWRPGGTAVELVSSCSIDCLGWTTATECAVWCYGRSPTAGRVGHTPSLVCDAACPGFGSPTWE
jgi:hypothetical protein